MVYLIDFPCPASSKRGIKYWKNMIKDFQRSKQNIIEYNFSDKKGLCNVLDWAIEYSVKQMEDLCMNMK